MRFSSWLVGPELPKVRDFFIILEYIYIVVYKYIADLFTPNPEDESFCKQHNVAYFKPSKKRTRWLEDWLLKTAPPVIESKREIVCYWRPFGTWGMYQPDDYSISVCPFKIEEAPGGLEGVIRHEILHLEHPEADKMTHEHKENFINHSK